MHLARVCRLLGGLPCEPCEPLMFGSSLVTDVTPSRLGALPRTRTARTLWSISGVLAARSSGPTAMAGSDAEGTNERSCFAWLPMPRLLAEPSANRRSQEVDLHDDDRELEV